MRRLVVKFGEGFTEGLELFWLFWSTGCGLAGLVGLIYLAL